MSGAPRQINKPHRCALCRKQVDSVVSLKLNAVEPTSNFCLPCFKKAVKVARDIARRPKA